MHSSFNGVGMKLKSNLSLGLIAAACVLTTQVASAQKAGDNFVYGGMAFSKTNSSLGPVTDSQPAFAPQTIGTTATIESFNTAIISAVHMYTDNVGVELTLGIPPKLKADITAPGVSAPLVSTPMNSAITQTALFPSVVAMYMFKEPGEKIRPYVGLGVNYTTYSSISPNTSFNTVAVFAGSGATLTSSWNPVYKLGAIYNIDDRWSINAGVAYVPLSTNVTLQANTAITPHNLANTATAKLTINPTDFTVKVGYKF